MKYKIYHFLLKIFWNSETASASASTEQARSELKTTFVADSLSAISAFNEPFKHKNLVAFILKRFIQLIFVFPFISVLYKGQLCKTDMECKIDDFTRELENEQKNALK